MRKPKMRLRLIAICLGLISGFSAYNATVVNNLFIAAQDWLVEVYGSQSDASTAWSVMVAVYAAAKVISAPLAGLLADHFGRRWTLRVSCVLIFIGGLLCALTTTLGNGLGMAMAGRCVMGAGVGVSISIVPIFLTEISPPSKRGSTIATFVVLFSLGDVSGAVISAPDILGTDSLWPVCLGLGALPAPFVLLLLFCIPETPGHLRAVKTSSEIVEKSVQFYRENLDESTCISTAAQSGSTTTVEPSAAERPTRWQLLKTPEFRRHLFIAILLQVAFHATGVEAWSVYSSQVFTNLGRGKRTAAYCTVVMSLGSLPVSALVAASSLWDKLSRKHMLILQTAYLCIHLCFITMLASIRGGAASIGTTALIILIYWSFTIVEPAFLLVPSETFGQHERALGQSLAMMFRWMLSSIIDLEFLPLLFAFGPGWATLQFAVASFILLPMMIFVIPND